MTDLEYYEDAYKKKIKSQPLYFQPELWPTLNELPWIGPNVFMNEYLYNSAKIIATRELGQPEDDEAKTTLENRIIEIYEEQGGEIEVFDSEFYQTPASLSQIHEATFKNKQYSIEVLIVGLELTFFPITLAVPVPLPVLLKPRVFTARDITKPEFTENYERVRGQRHISNYLTIDTTKILIRNGLYYPKIRLGGSSLGTIVGTIPFLGGGIPITSFPVGLDDKVITTAIGSIEPVETNEFGEDVENRVNWSLKGEIKLFEGGEVEKEKLSQLTINGLEFLGLNQ